MKNKKKLNLDNLDLPIEAYFGTLQSQKRGFSIPNLQVRSYIELLFKLESLLNVCILALDNANSGHHEHILEPDTHIKSVLELAAQMIPFEEAEFLDVVKQHFPE
ncbi:hypothetical protein [Flagellimonas flava]|uniref:hypothetical protein n=1 Tax=Flagellimonas flava TaxID=570519 RepID=UPI003D64ACD9